MAKSEGVVVAVDFGAPRAPPNRPPPRPPLAGCVAAGCAVDELPRLPNKLDVVPVPAPAAAPALPNSPPVEVPLEAG